MKLGYVGLGKMGQNMVERLLEKRYSLVLFDKDTKAAEHEMCFVLFLQKFNFIVDDI